MIVFGDARTFMSHIPMFRAPHDVQLILEVALSGPHRSFADGLYTFEPERFDLDALMAGRTTEMKGTLYRGSFENGGEPVAKDTRVQVRSIVASRVPIARAPAPAVPTYWLIGDPSDAYLVHVVGKAPGFDQIVRARVVAGEAATLRGETMTVESRTDELAARVLPGATVRIVGAGKTFELQPIAELSCLLGPDFDVPCSAGVPSGLRPSG